MGLFSKFGKNKQESAQDSGYYTSADDQAALERARSKRASTADAPRRRTRDREADDPVLPEKKRARRRLVGAIALALAVAVGLPMVLDSEPKPLASDIDINIPSKERTPDSPARADRKPVAIPDSDALDSREEIVEDVKPATKPATTTKPTAAQADKPAAKPDAALSAQAQAHSDELDRSVAASEARAKAEADARNKQETDRRAEQERKREAERKLAESKAEAKAKADARADTERKLAETKAAEAKAAEARAAAKPATESKASQDARALAILEGKSAKPAAAAESGQKFVLQVAALSDQNKVNELRERLKQAGISSYTQKAPSGDVTRVRVGPFSNKEEAEKVRAKLQGMGLAGRLETV
jgi:DedD protein